MKLKDINTKILLIIAAIVIIVAVAANYEEPFAATTELGILSSTCNCEFDDDDNCDCKVTGTARIKTTGDYLIVCSYWDAFGNHQAPPDGILDHRTIAAGDSTVFSYSGSFDNTEPYAEHYMITLQKAGINEKIGRESAITPDECILPTTPVPCTGLSPCNSDSDPFDECCAGHVWYCGWNNYDGKGFRMQWQLWQECDAGCTCDGTGKECWCSDLTPDCAGLGICDRDTFLCDACCDGDVWECSGHYKWRRMESCTADETCECKGSECQDCGCVATATPAPTPAPARINDDTDTLTFDKSSYQLGDIAYMYATGTNNYEGTWQGKVTFTITQPNGAVYETREQQDISVIGKSSKTVTEHFQLPSTGQSGTWTAQSKWIDNDGTIHAQSSILDLGGEESEDDLMWVIGGIAVFLLLLYLAYRKKQPKR